MSQKKKDFRPGTLVYLSKFSGTPAAAFGVVFKKKFWEQCANEQDSSMVEESAKYADCIPIRLLGLVIGCAHMKDPNESYDQMIVHYIWRRSNDHNIVVVNGNNFRQCLSEWKKTVYIYFYPGEHEPKRTFRDLEIFVKYLSGNYNLKSHKISAQDKKLFRLFEKGIPKEKVHS